MLILSRKIDESFTVDGPARIFVLGASRGRVKIGIEADKAVTILRTELLIKELGDPRIRDLSGGVDA